MSLTIQNGRPDLYTTLPTNVAAMRQWLEKQRTGEDRLHLTFEISGSAGYFYDHLVGQVDSLVVSNPSKMTWIYRTNKKSDRVDSRKQAVLLKMGELPTVHMPSPEVRQWRLQIQHRRKLINLITQSKNRIRALLKSKGYRRAYFKSGWWSRLNRLWLRDLAQSDQGLGMPALTDLLDQLELYENQSRRATKQLDKRLADHPGAELLMSIPGVGPRTSEAVLAYTDQVERFRRGKEYGAYFGLTPRLDQSGQRCRMGHISKQGPSVVRWLVVESAWRAIKCSPSLSAFYEQVQHGQPKRKKVAIVATARKLLTIMRAMLLSGELFNEQLVLNQMQSLAASSC